MQNGMVNFIAKLESVSEDDGCCAVYPSRPQIKYLDLGNASSWDDSALPITKRLSISVPYGYFCNLKLEISSIKLLDITSKDPLPKSPNSILPFLLSRTTIKPFPSIPIGIL